MKKTYDSPDLRYIRQLYAQEDDVLKNIRQTFEQRGMAIQVGAEEGKLLHMLMRLHRAQTVVEIGTLGGYSAIWIARALPHNGRLHTIEADPEHAELARGFIRQAGLCDKVTVWEGKGLDMLKRISDTVSQVDAVFIDADKINYPNYLDWAESNVRPGGLIVGDNTLLFGTVYLDSPPEEGDENYDVSVRSTTWQAMRDFNARLADENRFESVMIATGEGLSVAIRKHQPPLDLL